MSALPSSKASEIALATFVSSLKHLQSFLALSEAQLNSDVKRLAGGISDLNDVMTEDF